MATTTTSSTASSATASIVKSLGTGSGLDTAGIVDALVNAQFAAKNAALTKKSDALTAQISGLAQLKSGITGFDTALRTLVKGGTLRTQPSSSAAAVATVSTLTSVSNVQGLAATVTVNRLAQAQAATTDAAYSATAPWQAGTLTITAGGTTKPITVEATDTLTTIAAKITGAGLGLTAKLVGEGTGVRLSIKGQTGEANAFTIDAVPDDPAAAGLDLAALSVGANATGTTIGTTAQDAELVLDGATYHRATNTVTGLITGVKLELKGTGVTTLGTTPPTDAITQAVSDFVDTYNQLKSVLAEELDPVSGALRGDPAATQLARQLSALTTVELAANATGSPRTLGDIGVKTNRDGTLSVDATQLKKVLTAMPAAVEAMFADGTGPANGGLSAALGAITARVATRDAHAAIDYSFDGETERLSKQQTKLTDEQQRAADAATAARTRLTQQFASMDARVAAYKSTQAFLTQQVDAWNKDS